MSDLAPEKYADQHPFVSWYVRQYEYGTRFLGDRDFLLSPFASSRFALSREGTDLILGAQKEEFNALSSIPWARASLVRNFKELDWLALSSKNIRNPETNQWRDLGIEAGKDIPIRYFIRISTAIADTLESLEDKPNRLLLRPIRVRKGSVNVAPGPARFELELSYTTV